MGTRLNADRAGQADPADLREQAMLRSGWTCEVCGEPLTGATALHHRKPRSRGGGWRIENVLILHDLCHATRVHKGGAVLPATESGWLVPSWRDPAEVPVIVRPGTPAVYLTADGGYASTSSHLDGSPL